MKERRDYRDRNEKDYYPMDKKQKHDEVQQIKSDLINFANTSWGKKWVHSILKIGRPYRMRRAMRYAEEDRISNILIKKGEIFALVQGTAPTPYRVRIFFNPIPEDAWKIIEEQLSGNLLNLISLLEGTLSDTIITIFEQYHHSLFPDVSHGLNAKCSCPDQAVPCKHIAAVILYISRVIDYNPLILLKLKGKKKKQLLSELKIGKQFTSMKSPKSSTKDEIDRNTSGYSYEVPKISVKDIKVKDIKEKNDLPEQKIDISFQFTKPGRFIETLENLGLPTNLENPKAFAIVMDKIYKTITKQTYKISLAK
ncbi:MAG: SWIM zinc finger protein [Promethearchaeota archaeon]|nr:MAG: SWIM zinc finger protein [Candidatus Lokiarchaeota archaeon]